MHNACTDHDNNNNFILRQYIHGISMHLAIEVLHI